VLVPIIVCGCWVRHVGANAFCLCRRDILINADPAEFVIQLAQNNPRPAAVWAAWFDVLRKNELKREKEIDGMAVSPANIKGVNPVKLCRAINAHLAEDSILVADGMCAVWGDFLSSFSSYPTFIYFKQLSH
jgi:hypothetical protein